MSKIAFIGPLPPPLGGVEVINQSFQEIDYSCYEVTYFNTSNQNSRENLYKKRFPWKRFVWKSTFRDLRKSKAIIVLLRK